MSRARMRTTQGSAGGARRSARASRCSGPRSTAGRSPKHRVCRIPRSIDSQLIVVEHEQIGTNRYITAQGRCSIARGRAVARLAGQVSPVGADAADSGHVVGRTPQRRAAQPMAERLGPVQHVGSPIDYVRVSGPGFDPLLVNFAQPAGRARTGGGSSSIYMARQTSWSPRWPRAALAGGPSKAQFTGDRARRPSPRRHST